MQSGAIKCNQAMATLPPKKPNASKRPALASRAAAVLDPIYATLGPHLGVFLYRPPPPPPLDAPTTARLVRIAADFEQRAEAYLERVAGASFPGRREAAGEVRTALRGTIIRFESSAS